MSALPISEVALDELRVLAGQKMRLEDAPKGLLLKLREQMRVVIQEEIAFRDNPRNRPLILAIAEKPDDRIEIYREDIRAINGRLTSWRAYEKRQFTLFVTA